MKFSAGYGPPFFQEIIMHDTAGLIAALEEIVELIAIGRIYIAREKLKALILALKAVK